MGESSHRVTSGGQEFVDRYGPWAVVAGASEGVGAAYSRLLGELGVNVVLMSRRQQILDELAREIEDGAGVDTRAVAVDLASPEAASHILEATHDVHVGMLMYCAGADSDYDTFLAQPVETALAMIHRNCVVPTQLCHHFAEEMVTRGRGGIVLISSGAGEAGGPRMVTYGATKAFDTVMAEGLWAELQGTGVDVLVAVLGATDTPALRRLLVTRGELSDAGAPLPEVVSSQFVAEEVLANLTNGPTWYAGDTVRAGLEMLRSLPRSEAVKALLSHVEGGITGRSGATASEST